MEKRARLNCGLVAFLLMTFSLWAPMAEAFQGSFIYEGRRHFGDVTITNTKKGPVCSYSYTGTILVSDWQVELPVSGFKKTCGWVGPQPIERYQVRLLDGTVVRLEMSTDN